MIKRKLLLALFSLFCFMPLAVHGVISFSITEFTSDVFEIQFAAGPDTLDANGIGSPPTTADLFIIDATTRNNNWILGTAHTFTGSGSLGSASVRPESAAMFDNNGSGGDIVRITFDSNLTNGATVSSTITARWSGTNIFDPSGISSFVVTWGTENIGFVDPWGDVQGTTVTAVPEPSTYAGIFGLSVLLFLVYFRRK